MVDHVADSSEQMDSTVMAYEISNIHIEMKVTSDLMIKKNYFLCLKVKIIITLIQHT